MKLLQIGLLNFPKYTNTPLKYTNTPLPFYKGLNESRGERCFMEWCGGIYNCTDPPTPQSLQESTARAPQQMDLNLEHPLYLEWMLPWLLKLQILLRQSGLQLLLID